MQTSPGGRDPHETSPEDKSVGTISTKTNPKKKKRVPRAEAEARVQEFIDKKPAASIREIEDLTGVSQGAVQKSPAWRALMVKRRQAETEQSVKTRNMKDFSMDSFGIDDDPSLQLEHREVMEEYYLKSIGGTERMAYQAGSEEEKLQSLSAFLEKTHHNVERHCQMNESQPDVKAYRELVEAGQYESLFLFAAQIRDQQEERVLRKRSRGNR